MTKAVTVKDVEVILTQPARARLIIVKVVTSEPGLYGLGCATFTQRFHAVHAAIEKHLKPFMIGRDVSRVEEIMADGDGPRLLAKRPCAQQRHFGRGPGPVGHQGQNGQHARISACSAAKCERQQPYTFMPMGSTRVKWKIACVNLWRRGIAIFGSRWAGMAARRMDGQTRRRAGRQLL